MNNIIWDKETNEKLILERNISFDEISQMIIDGKYHRKYKGELNEN